MRKCKQQVMISKFRLIRDKYINPKIVRLIRVAWYILFTDIYCL